MNPQGSPRLPGSPSPQNPMSSYSQAKWANRRREDKKKMRRPRLDELMGDVYPYFELDEDIYNKFTQMADDFVNTTLNTACAFAKNQHAPEIQLQDIQIHLERYWNTWIPSLNNELPPTLNEGPKPPMTLIRKTVNK